MNDCDQFLVGSETIEQRALGDRLVAEYRSLLSYSIRLTSNGSEATDLVQTVCARALSQRTRTAKVKDMAAWLRSVLFRLFVDVRRRAKWEIPTDCAALDLPASPPELEAHPFSVTVEEVRALLPSLPAHYRVAFELFTFENRSYAEIAAVLGISQKTVATRINRARRKLRRLLQAQHRL